MNEEQQELIQSVKKWEQALERERTSVLDHDAIVGGVSISAITILITVNELLHEWILPALLLILPCSFLLSALLFNIRSQQILEQKRSGKRKAKQKRVSNESEYNHPNCS